MSESTRLPSWDETVPVGTIDTSEVDVPSDLPSWDETVEVGKSSWFEQMGARFAGVKSLTNNLSIILIYSYEYKPL